MKISRVVRPFAYVLAMALPLGFGSCKPDSDDIINPASKHVKINAADDQGEIQPVPKGPGPRV